ncbi:hypothetical protein GUITHDRAFT_104106 [Guillardia theta CCMP2712]|uniref:EGF-like domain-containing protein n=1 Tax=Guillardia theta (strain CCMP2712) TaxID=905079 RepID=L1JQ58_GUITC|nr:hypothetical protein GUITHDRAFT_104106 [Guillardia theta CCMP2712]EKX50295.1 hypothetical protein GUITHDRAFT_104106 [Guillardia theta CCMP2712]|eukprot:XP_005837275.1 hypothetical protein GUITHDRAFT_104106 [Guillardia theta CCMP2712]
MLDHVRSSSLVLSTSLLVPLLLLSFSPPLASSSPTSDVDRHALAALEWEIRSIKQSLSATLEELRSLNASVASSPQLPWGNLTSSVVRCSLPYNWSQIVNKEDEGRVQIGGLGHLMQMDRYEVWVCDYDNRCVQQAGDAMCFVFDEQGPFQPDLALSNILAQLKALQQEIRSGGCGGSCVSQQQVQQLLDQYYLEPGYLWSAGSFSECSSLCGSGVARRSITCISKLLEQVEDVRCSNRSRPLAEVPCLNLSQCSYEWEVGPYSECLTGCGQGLRRRPVSCRRSDGVTVEAAKCLGSAPVGEEPCANFSSCSYRWTTSAWEACSSTCGAGLQYRSVMCVRSDGVEVGEGMCEGSKPRTFQACTGASGCNYTLINECAAHTDNCATHASCIDTYSSFECSCKPGYVGSGTVCEDEDECVTQTGLCDAARTCVNTEGSFECLCKEGFYLDTASPSGSCVACPAGLYTSGLGQTSCSSCAPGYYGTADSSCSACPPGSSSAAGSQRVTDCQCEYGFSGTISSAADRCSPIFSNVEEQSRWLRLGASGMSCAQTCAAEGKTCVSSAINQIDNEEAMRSAVRAASIASDRRIRGAMTEPQQRPGGLHLRVSAGAHEHGGDGLQDLTASSGHVKRRRYVEHGATNFPLVPQSGPNAGRTCCYITQNFYVDMPVELQSSRMITVSVTIEGFDKANVVQQAKVGYGGIVFPFSTTTPLSQLNGRIDLPPLTAVGSQVGPIAIYYSSISYNGRSTWRISVGEMRDESEEPLRVMSDGKLKYVNGSFHDVVSFPPMSIPGPVFTLCSISRYNGDRRNRILQGRDDNFVHGHWSAGGGQAYYSGSWSLQQDLSATADAWVVLCGQNYQEGKFFLNGVEYDRSAGSLPDSLQLTINEIGWQPDYGYFLESSDWALSEVAIWRGALRADEMRAVSSHFMQKLSAGSSAPYNHTLNVSCGTSTAAINTMSPYVSDLGCFFRSQVYQSTCDASMFGASRVCVCSAPCLENFYGQADQCFPCPFYSQSQPGSSSIRDCSCDQGLYLYVNSSDAPWGPQGSCDSCPANAWSPTGSSWVNQCQCIGGYYLDQGPSCSSCPSGLLSPFASSSVEDCMCEAGSYGSAGNCSSCPAFSSSRAGSRSIEDCFCHAGFGVRATGYSRQVTSPHDQCELIEQEIFVGSQPGASCSAVCGSRSLACLDEAQPFITQHFLSALLSSWGVTVSQIVVTNSADAPSYNPVTGQAFYRNGLPGTCSAANANNVRVCRCTCANNQYGKTGNCSSCPAHSQSSFQAQDRSSCMCDSGYFLNASQGGCSPCPSGTYARRMEWVEGDFGTNGSMGWRGADKTSSCGAYGSVLGGLNVLGEHASVSKTFTGLCEHGLVYVKMRLLLVDLVQPVTLRLYVNRQEVWSETAGAMASWPSECGKSDGDELIERAVRVYHTEDYVEAMIRVDYDYWEVSASSAKTFWGLKDFSLSMPCASSTSADCSMTSPSVQSCSDVTGSGGTCMQAGDYLYVYYTSGLTWWDAESRCNGIGREGHLAYFPDSRTYLDVTSRLGVGASNPWIGLRSPAASAFDYRWVIGGSPSFWGVNGVPPSGYSQYEYGVFVGSQGEWGNYQTSNRNRYLCSYPIQI